MRAIVIREPGDENVMELAEVPAPTLGPADVRIRVRATAVNRADLLQRQGYYPPPPGASDVLGLECAGTVAELGTETTGFARGDRVMALLAGGGYAEEVCVHFGSVLPVPDTMSDEEAGAFPEAFLTAFSNIFLPGLGALRPREDVLVHGGGGGVGTAAIRLCAEAGHRCFVTVGSDDKARRCTELGATAAIDYKTEDFAARVQELTDEHGVGVILDHIGAKYLAKNLASLAIGGRLVEIGLMGGAQTDVNLALLLGRRLSIIGSTLRTRSVADKAAIVRALRERFDDALAAGRLKPVIHAVLPLERAGDAHRMMKASEQFGKIVLRVV
jgi:putative PIG3 family NAD(P)H quinone oxidoreductase